MEEEMTRVEKLIPDYGKLNFANKEEKVGEQELSEFDTNEIIIWRQLESQAHMANEQLDKASDIFQEWLDEYEDVKDMVVTQKALDVIKTFGRLLLALDSERQFLLANRKVQVDEAIEKREIKDREIEERKIDKRKVALLLYGETLFEANKVGRGAAGPARKVADILGVTKRTVENWMDDLVESGYADEIVKNIQSLIERTANKKVNKSEENLETKTENLEGIEENEEIK